MVFILLSPCKNKESAAANAAAGHAGNKPPVIMETAPDVIQLKKRLTAGALSSANGDGRHTRKDVPIFGSHPPDGGSNGRKSECPFFFEALEAQGLSEIAAFR
jgi:hypothetical protein